MTIESLDITLRPSALEHYVGQSELKEMLNIYIKTAKKRNESLDHVLFYGPPGLGKTTLAHIIANEMNSRLITTTGASLTRVGDIVSILSGLNEGDILFIDEIHRIPNSVEETLYTAMEDFSIDIIVGNKESTSTFKIDLPPFTLIGATTRCGDLVQPFRDRFGIVHQLSYYTHFELIEILKRTSKILNYEIENDAVLELAKRSRGTPRIANRLYKRVRDFAEYQEESKITYKTTCVALDKLKIDCYGLTKSDQHYLKVLIERFNGGPVGVSALAHTLNENLSTIEDVIEPYLLQEGFIQRSPRGRIATLKAQNHLIIKKGAA